MKLFIISNYYEVCYKCMGLSVNSSGVCRRELTRPRGGGADFKLIRGRYSGPST